MAIGPVQLIVLGFDHPDFHGEVIAELERLRAIDAVRVVDALAVYKDEDGELQIERLGNLSDDETVEFGVMIGPLVGLASGGTEGTRVFSDDAVSDVLAEIPDESAAALVLLEHHWAVPLRDALVRTGGFRIVDGFISPFDLVGIGLVSAAEARELHSLERATATASR